MRNIHERLGSEGGADALTHFKEVAKLEKLSGDAYGRLGKLDRKGDAYARVATWYLEKMQDPMEGYLAYVEAGKVYEQAGRFDEAAEMYRTAAAGFKHISKDHEISAENAVERCEKAAKAALRTARSRHTTAGVGIAMMSVRM